MKCGASWFIPLFPDISLNGQGKKITYSMKLIHVILNKKITSVTKLWE